MPAHTSFEPLSHISTTKLHSFGHLCTVRKLTPQILTKCRIPFDTFALTHGQTSAPEGIRYEAAVDGRSEAHTCSGKRIEVAH